MTKTPIAIENEIVVWSGTVAVAIGAAVVGAGAAAGAAATAGEPTGAGAAAGASGNAAEAVAFGAGVELLVAPGADALARIGVCADAEG